MVRTFLFGTLFGWGSRLDEEEICSLLPWCHCYLCFMRWGGEAGYPSLVSGLLHNALAPSLVEITPVNMCFGKEVLLDVRGQTESPKDFICMCLYGEVVS